MKFVNGEREALSASALGAYVGSFVCATAAIFFFSFAFAGEASADYVCQCVNGELAAIYSGNVSVKPVCAPRTCPAPTESLSMARNLQVSAQGGGSDCKPVQVMDTISGKYEWKVLCR
jgi:hypothetical protein